MNTKENINELMVAIEEVLGVKIDWIEENGDIKIDRENLTTIVEGLEVLVRSNNGVRCVARDVLVQARTGKKFSWYKTIRDATLVLRQLRKN